MESEGRRANTSVPLDGLNAHYVTCGFDVMWWDPHRRGGERNVAAGLGYR